VATAPIAICWRRRALADHGVIERPMAVDGGDAEAMLTRFEQAGVDIHALAYQLQREGRRPSSRPGNGCCSHLETGAGSSSTTL
jgi:hypothetical protein